MFYADSSFQEMLLKLMSKVEKGQVDRVKKLTGKGVDPNFIDPESGGWLKLHLFSWHINSFNFPTSEGCNSAEGL